MSEILFYPGWNQNVDPLNVGDIDFFNYFIFDDFEPEQFKDLQHSFLKDIDRTIKIQKDALENINLTPVLPTTLDTLERGLIDEPSPFVTMPQPEIVPPNTPDDGDIKVRDKKKTVRAEPITSSVDSKLHETYTVGEIYTGTITQIKIYGMHVVLDNPPGLQEIAEGVINNSELIGNPKMHEKVKVKVINIVRNKMTLSMKLDQRDLKKTNQTLMARSDAAIDLTGEDRIVTGKKTDAASERITTFGPFKLYEIYSGVPLFYYLNRLGVELGPVNGIKEIGDLDISEISNDKVSNPKEIFMPLLKKKPLLWVKVINIVGNRLQLSMKGVDQMGLMAHRPKWGGSIKTRNELLNISLKKLREKSKTKTIKKYKF